MEDFFPESEEIDQDVLFISELPRFKISNESALSDWIKTIIERHRCVLRLLTYIFVTDQQLLEINREYLQHDTLTDIITFPYSQLPFIHGDIFISIDRVKENAQKFSTSFENELHRVISHGVLHLCGFGDKTAEEEKIMRKKEDEALSLLEELT